jgi:hypothetical protein
MTSIRSVPASVLFVLFLSVASLNAAGASGSGTTEGTFVGIEQGDYANSLIKDKNGHDDSFTILRPDESVKPYLDNPGKFKGHPVKVYWTKKFIPEAGYPMKTVYKVE